MMHDVASRAERLRTVCCPNHVMCVHAPLIRLRPMSAPASRLRTPRLHSLVLASRPLYRPPRPSNCSPPTLVPTRSTLPLSQSRHRVPCTPNRDGRHLWIAHNALTDVQNLESPPLHVACTTRCPSPTTAWSGLHPCLEGFRLYIGSLRCLSYVFVIPFCFRRVALHSRPSLFTLDSSLSPRRAVPHPLHLRAQRRAPQSYSVKFHLFLGHCSFHYIAAWVWRWQDITPVLLRLRPFFCVLDP